MIRLSLLKDPVQVDLSDLYPGVSITLRRLTAPELDEARQQTVSVLRQAREGLEALREYGLAGPDAGDRQLDPRDANEMIRAGLLVGHVEVAMRGLIRWTGVVLEDGSEAPINRETLSVLLLDDALSRRIIGEIEKAARVLVSEGNGSGPSPGGSSAIRPGTTEGQTTAPAAGKAASPAPGGSAGAAGATAPKPSRRQQRARAARSGAS